MARIHSCLLPEENFHGGWQYGVLLIFSKPRLLQRGDIALHYDDVGRVEPSCIDILTSEDQDINIDIPFNDGQVDEVEIRP